MVIKCTDTVIGFYVEAEWLQRNESTIEIERENGLKRTGL